VEDVDEGFLGWGRPPELGAIRQGGQRYGVVKESPVRKVEAPDTVAKYFDRSDASLGTVGHDLDMMFPIESMMEKEAEVSYNGTGWDRHVRSDGTIWEKNTRWMGGAIV